MSHIVEVNSLEHLATVLKSGVKIEAINLRAGTEALQDFVRLGEEIEECHEVLDAIEGQRAAHLGVVGIRDRLKKLRKELQK